MDYFNFENTARRLDDIDEAIYGKRPRGTKRELDPSIQELTLQQLTGLPIKIKKNE